MIRPSKSSDVERILSIWLEASIQAHDFIEESFWKAHIADMRDMYLPKAETYVFENEGSIKGFISLVGDTVAALFVSPYDQGAGIGTQLLNRAKTLRQNLDLAVYKENRRSVGFYLRHGFIIERERIDGHTGHPELVMTFNS